jgi:hypothetical protein
MNNSPMEQGSGVFYYTNTYINLYIYKLIYIYIYIYKLIHIYIYKLINSNTHA